MFPNPYKRFLQLKRKEIRALMRSCDEYLSDDKRKNDIITCFRDWFINYRNIIIPALGAISEPLEFSKILDLFHDFQVPWSDEETMVILRCIEPGGNTYISTADFIDFAEVEDDERTVLEEDSFKRQIQKNIHKFINVFMRSATSVTPGNPLHLQVRVERKATIRMLIDDLLQLLDVPSAKLQIKKEKFSTECINEDSTIDSIAPDAPSVDLFYDYPIGYIDCPLIGYDDYFLWRTIDRMLDLTE